MPAEYNTFFLRLSHFSTLDVIRVPHEKIYHVTIAERNQSLAKRTTITLTNTEAMDLARFLANVTTRDPPPSEATPEEAVPEESDREVTVISKIPTPDDEST